MQEKELKRQSHTRLTEELESFEVDFRIALDAEQRRTILPCAFQKEFKKKEYEIRRQLFEEAISYNQALEGITSLMEDYYGMTLDPF